MMTGYIAKIAYTSAAGSKNITIARLSEKIFFIIAPLFTRFLWDLYKPALFRICLLQLLGKIFCRGLVEQQHRN